MHSRKVVSRLVAAVAVVAVAGFGSGEVAGDQPPEYEMTTYQFAMLVPVPDLAPLGEREYQALQEAHLAYMARLLDDGTVIVFGPLDSDGAIRSVVVLDVESTAKTEAILGEDAFVRDGRLVAEVHPWWAAKGILQKPGNPLHLSRCYLGLIRRPPDAPEYSDEKLQELQAGHLANIGEMADSGDLVLAGPMADDTALRGIFVFRTLDPERLRELVARDPAVKAGRLGVELFPWHVPKGTLPEPP